MKRTTIMLPDDLKSKALRRARKRGISLGRLIRSSLEGELKQTFGSQDEDPLFQDDAVFDEKVPRDLAENHDRYLYGEDS